MGKICCFCGHGKEWNLPIDIDQRVKEKIKNLIKVGVNIFYSGGMGAFDKKCETVVRQLKRENENIQIILIIPYRTKAIDAAFQEKKYDEIIYPDLGQVHFKAAIQKRNRWMIDNSDYLISYVRNSTGGARQSFEYAKKTNINIIEL